MAVCPSFYPSFWQFSWNLPIRFFSKKIVSFQKLRGLRVLQKARIKIVALPYTYLFLSFTYTLLFRSKLEHRPLFNYVYCKTFSVRFGLDMNHTPHAAYSIHRVKYLKFQSLNEVKCVCHLCLGFLMSNFTLQVN